jgi:hemolysin activation/secretion protein
MFGSDRNAWIIDAAAQTGFGSSKKDSLILTSGLRARLEDSGLQDMRLEASARFFRRQSERRLFFASLSGTYGHNLDLDNQVLLGGDSGLRGYPLRYRSGDKAALLTIEQRYFTDWYPFRLFRVGGAVFFDAGKTWNSRFPGEQEDELLRDVGFGLRLGNVRSGQGRMTHIDIAFPLDGDDRIKNVQFLIEVRKHF